ncbi:hypothetical protein [Paraburkholderia phenoliruptrix]|uniref:hypothetical protein n=1 Tax=Paraburkholderia phenoliruptrix TaxID=252970 RepID=UPI001CB789C2|nr:hypothetical protein [Paraburkholderia phenoliruptrix]
MHAEDFSRSCKHFFAAGSIRGLMEVNAKPNDRSFPASIKLSTYVTKIIFRSSIAPRFLTLCISLALYIGSLYLPAMYFEKEPPLYGMSVLGQGWFGLLTLNPSWLANPFYVAAIAQFIRRRYLSSRLLSLAAVGCALCSLWTSEWDFNEAFGTPIKHLGAAFYVWFVALLVLLSGSEYLRRSGYKVAEPAQEKSS